MSWRNAPCFMCFFVCQDILATIRDGAWNKRQKQNSLVGVCRRERCCGPPTFPWYGFNLLPKHLLWYFLILCLLLLILFPVRCGNLHYIFLPKGPAVILHVDDNNYVMTSLYSFWTPSSVPPISCVAGVPVIGSWVLLGVQVALSLQEDFWKQNMWTGRPIIYFTSRGQILSHGPYKTEGTMYL